MGEIHAAPPGVTVVGAGRLGDALRGELGAATDGDAASVVIVPPFRSPGRDLGDITDDDWAGAFDRPFEAAVEALGAARRGGARRIVVIVPTVGMSGAAHHVPFAAAAEAVRVTVKSAARQWGPDGVVVNALAVDPSWFGVESADVSLSGRTLHAGIGTVADLAPVVAFLASDGAHHLTGVTLTADGGSWM